MNKVITVSLSGRAYQLEEGAHAKVRAYLDEAARRLAADPGKAEILADLELALSEKCGRYLSPAKNVVTDGEMDAVLKEMGPVESSSGEEAAPERPKETRPGVKRLYRIKEEGVFAGVCAGLAAYMGLDPAVIRLVFALLALFTGGSWVLAYLILVFVMPRAFTEEQRAAAYGDPFTAREWVDQAKGHYEKLAESRDWRGMLREARARMRQERRERRQRMYPNGRLNPLLLVLIGAAVSLVWLFGLAGIINGGALFGRALPAGLPLWLAMAGWSCLYAVVVVPLKLLRRGVCCAGASCGGYGLAAVYAVFNIMLWTALVWGVFHFVPGSHMFFDGLNALTGDITRALSAH
jgi:phage shock protein PspC (stress-responsive transcriptional regulator)